jgi:hypothetical protein
MPKKYIAPKGVSAAQSAKENIKTAKVLVKKGLLSKQVNLHDDKYISKRVLKKVRQYSNYTSKDFVAVKVSKAKLAIAKANNYVVGNGRIVVPKGKRVQRAIIEGLDAGIIPLKRGYMEEIIIPIDVSDLADFERFVLEELPNKIEPGEAFAFKFYGNFSHKPLRDAKELWDYFQHYKSIFNDDPRTQDPSYLKEQFENLVIIRAHQAEINDVIPSLKERQKANAERRGKVTFKQKYSRMSEERKEKYREKQRLAKAKYRAGLTPDEKAKAVEKQKGYNAKRKK